MSCEVFLPVGVALENIKLGQKIEANFAKGQVRLLRADTLDRMKIENKHFRDKEWVHLIYVTYSPDGVRSTGGRVLHSIQYDEKKGEAICAELWEKKKAEPGGIIKIEMEPEELHR